MVGRCVWRAPRIAVVPVVIRTPAVTRQAFAKRPYDGTRTVLATEPWQGWQVVARTFSSGPERRPEPFQSATKVIVILSECEESRSSSPQVPGLNPRANREFSRFKPGANRDEASPRLRTRQLPHVGLSRHPSLSGKGLIDSRAGPPRAARPMADSFGGDYLFCVNFFSSETVNYQRPLRRRAATTARPPRLAMRLRKPCSRLRGIRFG